MCVGAGRPGGFTHQLSVLDGMFASTACLAVLLWVGLGPGALAAFLQATGQKSVPPAQAQVIYSTTPLWAAGCAALVLDAGSETMGFVAWLGGVIMLGSSLMTALIPASSTPPANFTAASRSLRVELTDRLDPKDLC